MPFTADAIENARIVENGGELQIFTPKAYSLALRPDDLNKAIRHFGERPCASKSSSATQRRRRPQPRALAVAPSATEDEATARALANPEVQRFREVSAARSAKFEISRSSQVKLPGNMQQMMRQAQQMQEKLQQDIALIKVEATAGGGMVTVKMDGQKNLLAVKIDPEVAGDVEMLQDMIVAACNEAVKKVDGEIKQKMGGMLGGMGLPPGMF